MVLQYQNCLGRWIDAAEGQVESYLASCERHNGIDAAGGIGPAGPGMQPLTRNAVLAALQRGLELRNDGSDWYSLCRAKPTPRAQAKPELVACSCGHSVPRALVMTSSRGSCCPGCYDQMSD